MNYLTDDVLSYLTEIILDKNGCYGIISFILCSRIKLISDKMINHKIKRNYKILIRNNTLLNPLFTYSNIYKIYENNFTVDKEKLFELTCLIIFNNDIELIEIICKIFPSSIKSVKDRLYHKYRTDDSLLWDLYIKFSGNKRSSKIRYILKNTDNEFIKFKQLIYNFVK